MRRNGLMKFILSPSFSGARAMALTATAVAVPTLIRNAVDSFVSGCELTIYLPFVLVVAVLAGWKYATAAALASALVAERLLMGPDHDFLGACDTYAVGVHLLGSAALIAVIHAFQSVVGSRFGSHGRDSTGGIVFSVEDGKAWASWYGQPLPMQLGPQDEVAEMMKDFLKQVELGKRLNAKP